MKKPSSEDANNPDYFIARLYQPGSVDAEAYGLRVENGDLLLCDADGKKIDVIDGKQWLLKVGGTGGDRAMLEDTDNNQSIITDLRLLDALAKNSSSPYFTKAAKKLKSGSFARKLQNSSGGLFFGFGAIVAVGFVCLYLLLMAASCVGSLSDIDKRKGDNKGHAQKHGHASGRPDYIISEHTGEDENGHGSVDTGKVMLTPKQRKEATAKTHAETVIFMRKALANLNDDFKPANFEKSLTATLMEDVEEDGMVGNIRTTKSSGDKEFDFVCQEVLSHRRKLAPPPAGLPHPTEVEYNFHYVRDKAEPTDEAETQEQPESE